MQTDPQLEALKKEVAGLFNSFQRVRDELASLNIPSTEDNLLGSVAEQMTAITEETSSATNSIMEATEAIQTVNERLLKEIKFGGARPNFEEIALHTNKIFEACSFHDITGQRLTKIATAISILEDSFGTLATVVGKSALQTAKVEKKSIHRNDDGLELTGPRVDDTAYSQEDIDKLFD